MSTQEYQEPIYRALEVPLTLDISPLSFFLYRQGVDHKVSEESGRQVLWLGHPDQIDPVRQLYHDWQSGQLDLAPPPVRTNPISISALISTVRHMPWTSYPLTFLLLTISILVTLVAKFGQNWTLVAALNFVPLQFVPSAQGMMMYFSSLSLLLEQQAYWRLLTPVFLHFSLMHLVFNMLWLFDLGRRIEVRLGGFYLLVLFILTGVASNLSQYFFGGETTIFGGGSGVIYGLLGYCMVREKLDKSCQFGIFPAIYGFMLVFLLIGYTGILDSLLGGGIANSAHTGGLLSGAVLGAVTALFNRCARRSSKKHK